MAKQSGEPLTLQFLGATRTVTGSKFLMSCEKNYILLDCGLFQGLKDLRLRNWATFPIPPAAIRAVVLTHAHIDQSGYLPRLFEQGFCGAVYGTIGTSVLFW